MLGSAFGSTHYSPIAAYPTVTGAETSILLHPIIESGFIILRDGSLIEYDPLNKKETSLAQRVTAVSKSKDGKIYFADDQGKVS